MKKILFLIVCLVFFICLSCMGKTNFYNVFNESPDKVESIEEEVFAEEINYDLINENIYALLEKYPVLKNFLIEANIKIPLMNKFIPQGITLMQNYFLITGYYESDNYSKVYVLNNLGEIINTVELDMKSHVGGIAYDKVNDLIWLPDVDGILNVYKAENFLLNKKVKKLKSFNNVGKGLIDYQDKNKNLIAYVAMDGEYLYIGNFYKTKECLVKKYKVSFDHKVRLEYIDSFYLPKKVQGITFYERNNEKYLIVSSSFNRRTRSNIYIYKYDEKKKEYNSSIIRQIELPPMAEQLDIKDDKLYIIFESSASKYPNAQDKVDRTLVLDLNKMLL